MSKKPVSRRANAATKKSFMRYIFGAIAFIAVAVIGIYTALTLKGTVFNHKTTTETSSSSSSAVYKVSDEEKAYLKERFDNLSAINSEVIGYVYIPGTQLDEPVVQTSDNATYLEKTFEGGSEPYMGTVFMDTDNKKDFSNELTWLFGHARGSAVEDHRMFNDVNFFDSQEYMDAHPYAVIETPERKHYYEIMFMVIVPENTAYYNTSFASKKEFKEQLTAVEKDATIKSKNVKINENDHYVVLSTCREEAEDIRANLYMREIPDSELTDFLAQHASQLTYTATR